MQSLTNGVYSLLLGAEGEAGAALPPPMRPTSTPTPTPTPTPTGCGRPGVRTLILLGPGAGTLPGVERALALASGVAAKARESQNDVRCVLLKTPETPVSLEERVKAYFAGTDVAASAETERCDVGKGYAALKMVADKRVPAVAFDAETRTLQLNTGELSVVVATFCRTTYRLTAPPESVVPSASVAEEGLRALGATLRGVLSTAFSGRKLRGTAVGVVERDDELMRMIYWQEGEDPGSPVVLYTVVSEAYAQYAGRKLARRAAAGAWPRWHTTSALRVGAAIQPGVDEMAPLDQAATREKLGVRAWFAPTGRSEQTVVVRARDEDNLAGRDVRVEGTALVFR